MRLFTIIKSNSRESLLKTFRDSPIGAAMEVDYRTVKPGSHPIYINTDSDLILKSIQDYKNIHGIPRLSKHIEWETRSAELGSPVESMLLDFATDQILNPMKSYACFT